MKELPEKREEFVAVNSKRNGARRWEEGKGKRRNVTQDTGCSRTLQRVQGWRQGPAAGNSKRHS